MDKKWKIRDVGDPVLVSKIAGELKIDTVLASLLVQRDIDTYEKALLFFRPQLEDLHYPFLLKDMDKAVARILLAMSKNEKILIYGDYDVDGTTAVALLYSFFSERYPHIDYYIPDRYGEGYGISYKGMDFAKENGFTLIITVDCGIKANEQIDYANSLGIDIVVTDHHLPGDALPNATAIVNPKRLDCDYPDTNLSGCGVGFKLAQAFSLKNAIPFQFVQKYIDLVAISIASDIVPIVGENRILAYFGLQMLNKKPRTGIKSILSLLNFNKEISISDIVFVIGPRLNAAGRINTGRAAVELMIAKEIRKSEEFAEILDSDNDIRKDLDTKITEEAMDMIASDPNQLSDKTTVLFNPTWHKGVLGIVASRLTEHYYRPTIILTQADDLITGSARSVKGYDLYAALESCVDLLEHFGGHKYAAGLAMKPENFPLFKERFEKFVTQTIEDEMLVPEIEIDAEIKLSDISTKFYRILKQFAPFGPENMKPIFKTSAVLDRGFARKVGNDHLKMNLISDDHKQNSFSAIAFKQAKYLEHIANKKPFDICYTIEENEWNGQTSLQLNVKDIKIC
ncbi:MAG: single-stranded-DNA-specific exonuclease RecJ [Bacteroidetes bacterium]|nr:single-stranded-DNA-specific exonuclease RecJ [Bacteroidota bacterium]MBU1718639.1 single-stranded-DNA-specific exonuclease RecJ [Bacteroidota bacterium]